MKATYNSENKLWTILDKEFKEDENGNQVKVWIPVHITTEEKLDVDLITLQQQIDQLKDIKARLINFKEIIEIAKG